MAGLAQAARRTSARTCTGRRCAGSDANDDTDVALTPTPISTPPTTLRTPPPTSRTPQMLTTAPAPARTPKPTTTHKKRKCTHTRAHVRVPGLGAGYVRKRAPCGGCFNLSPRLKIASPCRCLHSACHMRENAMQGVTRKVHGTSKHPPPVANLCSGRRPPVQGDTLIELAV